MRVDAEPDGYENCYEDDDATLYPRPTPNQVLREGNVQRERSETCVIRTTTVPYRPPAATSAIDTNDSDELYDSKAAERAIFKRDLDQILRFHGSGNPNVVQRAESFHPSSSKNPQLLLPANSTPTVTRSSTSVPGTSQLVNLVRSYK